MANDKIFVSINDEVIEAEGKLLEEVLAYRASKQAIKESHESQESRKAAQRVAILERLGLTEDEAKLILS